MEIWIALVGGVILGWVLEWIIDWVFWRRGVEGFYATEADLRRRLAAANARAEAAEAQLAEVRAKTPALPAGSGGPAYNTPVTQPAAAASPQPNE